MRAYKTTGLIQEEVDLDNPKTYEHLPKTQKELEILMFSEIGRALCYMDFLKAREGFFPKEKQAEELVPITEWYPNHANPEIMVDIVNSSYHQRQRIYKLIDNFSNNRHKNYENIMWCQEQVFLFQDETENMC